MNTTKPTETTLDIMADFECPNCGKNRNADVNPVTMAAMQEAEDMISGKKPSTWHNSPGDFISALKNEIES